MGENKVVLTKNRDGKTKNKVVLKIVIPTLIICALALLACLVLNIKIVVASSGSNIKAGVTANGIQEEYDNTVITLVENDFSTDYTYIGLGIQSIFSDEQLNYIKSNFIINRDIIEPKYNTENLLNKLEELNGSRQNHVYANLKKTDSEFTVTESVDGNMIDTSKLSDSIISELDGTDKIFDLTKYYVEKDSTKPTYEELVEEVEKVNNTYIEYTNGYKISLIDYIDYCSVLDNTIVLNEDTLEELKNTIDKTIEKELIEYDTVGNAMKFTTTNGEIIEVTGGTWGNVFSSDDETEYIIDKFSKFESENNRLPIYSQEMSSEIEDTYIEVSIQDQHVWHYVNGELCCESDCVTGKCDGNHETPTGVFYILEQQNGRTLRPKGSTSGTWVNKWMRITWDGVGLHDAYWRGAFGGTIYKNNGSHGCINLPKSYAYSLYDEVSLGTCVVVY